MAEPGASAMLFSRSILENSPNFRTALSIGYHVRAKCAFGCDLDVGDAAMALAGKSRWHDKETACERACRQLLIPRLRWLTKILVQMAMPPHQIVL